MRFQECIKRKCVSQRWKKCFIVEVDKPTGILPRMNIYTVTTHPTPVLSLRKKKKQQLKLKETEVSGQVVRVFQAYFVQRYNAGHIIHIKSNTIVRVIRELNLFRAFFILQNTYFGYSAETSMCKFIVRTDSEMRLHV